MQTPEVLELIEYLKSNLRIEVRQETDYGPCEVIKVRLYLGEEVITEDSCILPSTDRESF